MNAARLLLITVLLVPVAVAGQDFDKAKKKRASVLFHLGSSVGGPASGLANQLRGAGYDDGSPRCFFNPCGRTPHPSEHKPEVASGLAMRFPVTRALAVGGGISGSSLGGAIGYEKSGSHFVFSIWEMSSIWAGAFWTLNHGLRLGAGPAWYRLHDSASPSEHNVSMLGLLGEIGVELPANRRLFLDVTARLNAIPGKDILYSNFEGDRSVSVRPRWSHIQLLGGLGVHL